MNPFLEMKLRSREVTQLLQAHRASKDSFRTETQPKGPGTHTPLHHITKTAANNATNPPYFLAFGEQWVTC